MRDFQPLSYQADRCAAEPRSARFFSIAKLFRPSQSERRMRDVSTTPCRARSAELEDTDTPKESDTSCGACAVSARREPRPAAPRSPRRSQLFHHLYHSSHHFAPAISALCSQAQYARFPASLLRSAQRGVGRRDAKKRIRDKLRSVRSHGPAPAKATHSPIIHFQFPIPTPISVLFSSVLLFLRRMKSTGAHKPFYSIESRTHLK
ncbi:unknown [Bacteroides sp. CAG:927]|nr:unknown [Bacteroides sp. CAG:927]